MLITNAFCLDPLLLPLAWLQLLVLSGAKAGEVIRQVVSVPPSVVLNYTCEATEAFGFIYFTATGKPVLTWISSGRAS